MRSVLTSRPSPMRGGGRLYAAYPYIKPGLYLSGVAFSLSTDQGATWSSPTTALPKQDIAGGEGYREVRLAAAPGGAALYAAALWTHWHGENLYLSSAGNQGSSWTPIKAVAQGSSTVGTSLWGFALAAGRGGNVLVAYGLGQYLDTGPSYSVEVARSADHGASFLYGSAEWSDDFVGYPDIKIGPFGTAHLVYAKGFNPGRAILYKYSYAPYRSWSAEVVRLDDDLAPTNVSAPRLAVGACGKASVLHATWHGSPSEILYTRKVAQPGYAWSEPLKIGTLKNGIYTNGLAAAGPKAFSIFSGRTAPVPQDKWGIAGSRVSSGVTCP